MFGWLMWNWLPGFVAVLRGFEGKDRTPTAPLAKGSKWGGSVVSLATSGSSIRYPLDTVSSVPDKASKLHTRCHMVSALPKCETRNETPAPACLELTVGQMPMALCAHSPSVGQF